jgi:glycerol 2-dehydrogenase (NADP+)
MHWPHCVVYDGSLLNYLQQVVAYVKHSENDARPRHPDGQIKLDETGSFNDTWAEMEKVLASGKAKAIGVSNFSIKTYASMSGC